MVSQEIIDKARYPLRGFMTGGYQFDMLFLGNLARVQGDLGEAEKWFDRALDDAAHRAYRYYGNYVTQNKLKVGWIRENLDDPSVAERWFIKAVLFGFAQRIIRTVSQFPQYADSAAKLKAATSEDGYLSKEEFNTVASELLAQAGITDNPALVGEINYNLGLMAYYLGNLERALEHLTAAAGAGFANAYVKLGDIYQHMGDKGDSDAWYAKAAASRVERKIPSRDGSSVTVTQFTGPGNSFGFIEYQADHQHSGRAIKELAQHSEHRMDIPDAVKWYSQLADGGDPAAMNSLGYLAEQSGNQPEAAKWYTEAAELGNRTAMYRLGHFARQQGDAQTAKHWWKLSADAGNCVAMAGLGDLAREEDDYYEAAIWYRMAIGAGLGDL